MLARGSRDDARSQLLPAVYELHGLPPWAMFVLLGLGLILLGAGTVVLATHAVAWHVPFVLVWVVALLGLLFLLNAAVLPIAAVTGIRRTSESMRAFVRGRVSDDRCGACAMLLRGVPVDDEGMRTCPECGGAWRVSEQAKSER